jgi:hypothetical protein
MEAEQVVHEGGIEIFEHNYDGISANEEAAWMFKTSLSSPVVYFTIHIKHSVGNFSLAVKR